MSRLRSLLIAAGLMLAVPAGAEAATLEAGRSCYPVGDDATLTGSGYAPDSPITFTVNGRRLAANVTSNSEGEVRVSYEPPDTDRERRLVIRATDSEGTSARTTIYVTRELKVIASDERGGNVETWRAVFRLFGFGRGKAYIHYVDPKGRFQKTVRLGQLRGPCGRLTTRKRRVMPFREPQFGRWKLQFDTRRRYDADTRRRRVLPVRVHRG